MDQSIIFSWEDLFRNEKAQSYFSELMRFINCEYENDQKLIFPKKKQLFRALDLCPLEEVKVVIIGQDPYPTKGHANGLCFSVEPSVSPLPKSLKNIFKELESDLNISKLNGDLTSWGEQGVLLLNTVLSVEEGRPDSHANKGWEFFTDAIINELNKKRNLVYILWGSKAQKKAEIVNEKDNCILKSPHPSPLSSYRGFFGCKHFSKTNNYLESKGKKIIEW